MKFEIFQIHSVGNLLKNYARHCIILFKITPINRQMTFIDQIQSHNLFFSFVRYSEMIDSPYWIASLHWLTNNEGHNALENNCDAKYWPIPDRHICAVQVGSFISRLYSAKYLVVVNLFGNAWEAPDNYEFWTFLPD